MTHAEAIAIKVYYEILEEAHSQEIELRYLKDEIEYYKNSKLTMKEFKFIKENLDETEYFLIDLIVDFLAKIDEVQKGYYNV